MAVSIQRGHDPAGVERILRALPSWFGIEESIVHYVADATRYPSFLAVDGGVTTGVALVHRHYPESAELHLIAVDPDHHRTGVGSALIRAITADLAADGVRVLQVHTVGPSWPDAGYECTRAFYRRQGFVPVQEFDHLDWDGPTQILVFAIGPGRVDPDQRGQDDGDRPLGRWQFNMAWALLDLHLADLTEADCSWPESESGWWTVRPTDSGTFAADWAEPEPVPAPPVTIGWLTWHICWWWRSAIAGLRNEPRPSPAELSWAGSADSAVRAIRALRTEWLDLLAGSDADLWSRPATFPWHGDPLRTTAHVVWWVNSELMKNAAEIGQLRRMRALTG